MAKQYKAYGILAYSPNKQQFLGQIERSFSMDFSEDRVRIYSEWEILLFTENKTPEEKTIIKNKYLDQLRKHAEKFAKQMTKLHGTPYEPILFRAGSKKAPVHIKWDNYYKATDKFERRNINFTKKNI